MLIGYFEYDGKTYFFGRASDGTVTAAFGLDIDAISDLKSIEDIIQGRAVNIKNLNPSIQAHLERRIRKFEHEYIYEDWVNGFVILSFNDPVSGHVYLVFKRLNIEMEFCYSHESRDQAIEFCIPRNRDPIPK